MLFAIGDAAAKAEFPDSPGPLRAMADEAKSDECACIAGKQPASSEGMRRIPPGRQSGAISTDAGCMPVIQTNVLFYHGKDHGLNGWLMMKIHLGFCILCLLLLNGCTSPDTARDEYPRPGEMRVVSIDMTGDRRGGAHNLIHNGDFSIWYSGADAPEGFYAPASRRISDLRRIESRGGVGRYTVDQWWRESDAGIPYFDLFHTVVENIEADQVYAVTVHARVLDNAAASVSVIAIDENDESVAVWSDLVMLEPGVRGPQYITKKIRTRHRGALAITAHTNQQTEFGETTRIFWFEWRLERAAAGDDDAAEASLL